MKTHRAVWTAIMLALLVSACAATLTLEKTYDKKIQGASTLLISSDGNCTIAGTKETLYCLGTDGDTLWTYRIGILYNTAISADGKSIATSGDKLRMFEKDGTLRYARQADYFVSSVAISSVSGLIAASYENSSVLLINEEGVDKKTFETPEKLVSLAISGDGEFITGGSETGSIYLFTPEGRVIWKFHLGGTDIASLEISEDGQTIAASSDDMIYLFTSNGKLLWKAATGSAGEISLTRDGSLVAAGGDAIHLYNRDGKLLYEGGGAQKAVAISDDGSHLVAAGTKGLSEYTLREVAVTAETTEVATLIPATTETEKTEATEPTQTQSGLPGIILCLTALACILRLRA